jgi:hypothetical protein
MTTLLTNQEAVFNVQAFDDSNAAKPAGFSAKVSGYPGAYVAIVGSNNIHFVAVNPGTYTVTVTGHSQDGTALPTLTLDFTVNTPPVPQATHLVLSDPVVGNKSIVTPADPGTDTVTGNV